MAGPSGKKLQFAYFISYFIVIFFSWTILSKGKRCDAQTRETRPDHNTGNYECPTLFDKSVGSSPAYHTRNTEDAGDGAYGLYSLSEKT